MQIPKTQKQGQIEKNKTISSVILPSNYQSSMLTTPGRSGDYRLILKPVNIFKNLYTHKVSIICLPYNRILQYLSESIVDLTFWPFPKLYYVNQTSIFITLWVYDLCVHKSMHIITVL